MVPFKSGMVVVDRDFCGREREIAALTDYLKACSRVCLVGERRIGKTSLVHETARRMRGHSIVFIDLLGVKAADHVVRRVIDGIFRSATESMLSKLAKSFAALRPVVSVDPTTNDRLSLYRPPQRPALRPSRTRWTT